MKKKEWDKNDFIKNYQKLKSSRKMAELYHCSKTTIIKYAKEIGYNYQENREIKIANIPSEDIISLYNKTKSCKKIAMKYNCSKTAVRNYLYSLGIEIKNENKKLNITEQDFIKDYETFKNFKKIAEKYNCSITAVRKFASKINYDFTKYKRYKLTEENKQYIIDNYNILTSNELAKIFNVSRGMITRVWYDNNLHGKQVLNLRTTEINLANKTFGKWHVLYKTNERTASGGIKWHCRCECGVEKNISGLSLINGTSLSCGAHNNISKGNEKIKMLLMQNNIPFEMEKIFSTCKDTKCLPFDFYVNNSYLIEYDGLQHFQKDTIFNYEYTHKHDLMKNEWCRKNNITLIRIPYTHFNNLSIKDLIPETSNFIENDADYKLGKIGEA